MAISYDPLWKLLIDKKMKKLDLCKETGISTSTLAKMGKNKYVSLEVLEKICLILGCRIEEVVEITENKTVE
ncbi:MAG: helix-turn-helix transcriptional regulator [Monoglobales bacterium]